MQTQSGDCFVHVEDWKVVISGPNSSAGDRGGQVEVNPLEIDALVKLLQAAKSQALEKLGPGKA